ncbi:MAG: (E)-4-hydroxy-3-methylbut-2-enyl-diphosphate synthase, partial [Prevotellaceae bacterium]|nr:(E)-4-hydroxy-3-methylbut-2-enyl-diphosphate synthase [Prevotellaceae bacterium]
MRRKTHPVTIGNVTIGGSFPIVVQSMCNTATLNIEDTLLQCIRLHAVGAGMIRFAIQGEKEVAVLALIKNRLRNLKIQTPLIADVHFSPEVALASAQIADKVRINPGNFAQSAEDGKLLFNKLIDVCRAHRTALRIGVNHGSLSAATLSLFGDTPQGMSWLAMQWLKMCKENDFDQVVVSMKSSNPKVMVTAYREVVAAMDDAGMAYPLHLGVTEAGNGQMGRMKGAVAISALLHEGLGDTIRISLTEPPENEVVFGKSVVDWVQRHSLRSAQNGGVFRFREETIEDLIVAASCTIGPMLLDEKISDVEIEAIVGGTMMSKVEQNDFVSDLMQATRFSFSKPEYIACPGCGRTLFDIE